MKWVLIGIGALLAAGILFVVINTLLCIRELGKADFFFDEFYDPFEPYDEEEQEAEDKAKAKAPETY